MPKPPRKKSSQTVTKQDDPDQIADEITKRIGSIVSKDQRERIIAQMVSIVYKEERYSGPIAHPTHLREYEEILPGAADRIISMAESQHTHSKEMQETALNADIEDQRSGRRYGFAALACLMTCALIAGLYDHDVLAAAFLGAGALGTIGAFINGRTDVGNNKES